MKNDELATTLESHLESGITAEAKNIGKYVSSLFTRGTTLTVQPESALTISEENMNDSWKKIATREKEKGNPDPWFDEDIWKWFKGVTIPAIANEFTSTIQRFTQTLTHKQILDEAEKMAIKKVYTWLEAKRIIENAILAGEVETRGIGIIAYFKVEGNENFYRFLAWRHWDDRLKVGVCKVRSGKELDAGYGACCSN
ncbi:MAG: hypothetical protein KBB75_02535 [Candidatus Pacebacteria bacterium]|nr:hypothetical protein [Candidatus Paceibacterota bacterium]